jgi:glyceraldehyde 3-phosphate dehydrogenase
MINVAINGFGRIGRAFLRLTHDDPLLNVVAINDLADIDNLAYLLSYDSVYGKPPFSVEVEKIDEWQKVLVVGGKRIPLYAEKDPHSLPWKEKNIDIVLEATGFFTTYKGAYAHITAGASRVVISAPLKKTDEHHPSSCNTALIGTSEDSLFKESIISSNGSCTTNAIAPVMSIMNDSVGIEKALMSTIHAYTATQKIVDSPDAKDWRRGRAGAQNIIPSSTGAAKAVTEVIPSLSHKFDGIAFRVPILSGSLADITFISKRDTSIEEVKDILEKEMEKEKWKSVLTLSYDLLVSSDIIGSTTAGIVDMSTINVVDKNLVKICLWYDNEMGYTGSLKEHVKKIAEKIKK